MCVKILDCYATWWIVHHTELFNKILLAPFEEYNMGMPSLQTNGEKLLKTGDFSSDCYV